MNFENLKGVMGDSYHDGITADEVNAFFAGKNFADLSTGQYVDKSKHERMVQELNKTISDQKNALDSKLTDGEKISQDLKSKDAEIARLTSLLQENSVTSNKDLASGVMASTKALLDIKDDDSECSNFVNNIVSEDREKTNSIASYFVKITKDAYEKGKKDAMKDSMGEFGKGYKQNADGKSAGESLGKQLGKLSTPRKIEVDYFKRN